MRRNALFSLAVSAAIGAFGLGAGAQLETAAAQTTQQFTDAQLQAYVAANREIEPISSRIAQMSPQERTQATAQIRRILQRHRITGDQYNGIETQARTDDALAQRIAALHVQNLSDDTLRRFAAAAREIHPITAGLSGELTETQRAQAAAQIRTVLDRHSISVATYNAIAARAQADQTLAARIAQLQTSSAPAPSGD